MEAVAGVEGTHFEGIFSEDTDGDNENIDVSKNKWPKVTYFQIVRKLTCGSDPPPPLQFIPARELLLGTPAVGKGGGDSLRAQHASPTETDSVGSRGVQCMDFPCLSTATLNGSARNTNHYRQSEEAYS